jgi:hypothetical protein
LPVEMDAALVGWAEARGVSVSEALRVAVELLVAGGSVESPRWVSGQAPPGGERGGVSRAELFAGLRVPVSVRGRRASERSE